MSEEPDWLYESDDVLEYIRRFEDMIDRKAQYFFDVHELEGIINYYIDVNSFSKAVAAAEYACRLFPMSTTIQIKIAQLLIDRGKNVDALELLLRIEQLESSNYEVFMLKGLALSQTGLIEEAAECFDKAAELAGEDIKDEVLFNIGASYEQQNQFNIAVKYFLQALEENQLNINVLYDLAYCYDRINDAENSILFYNKYLDEDPFSDNVWFNLGTVYSRIQQNDKALEAYDFAIAINEMYGSAIYNKANILSNLERYDEALPEYLEFLKIEDTHVMVHCYIGECYEKLNRYDESLLFFEKAILLDPKCADAWFGLGVVKMHAELYEESLQCIKTALELNEDHTEYLYALGLVYMKLNDYENGIRVFKQVVELDPLDFEAWLNYSELLLTANRLDSAIEILHRACDFNYNNPDIILRLASYLFKQGEIKQGCGFLDRALNLDAECVEELYELYPEAAINERIKNIIEKHFDQNPV